MKNILKDFRRLKNGSSAAERFRNVLNAFDVYSGETDHLIPWQSDQQIC